MIVRGAIAELAVGGAEAVSVWRDLEGGPVHLGQGGDEAGDDAGFADAARVSADDEDGHAYFFAKRDNTASSFRYSRIGRAGVPQNKMPFPRIVLFDGTPHCAPRMAPSSIVTWSAIPTWPATITFCSMTALPEIPVCAAMTTFFPTRTLWATCTRLSIFTPSSMMVASSAP